MAEAEMVRSFEKVLEYLGETPAKPATFGKPAGTSRETSGPDALRMAIPRAPALRSRTIAVLAERLDVSQEAVLLISDIALRTFHRRQQGNENLTPSESDRVLRIARVAQDAERVFGDRAKAARWLKTESRILGAAPLTLLGTDAGAREVEMELGRIDHGIFA